MGDGAAQLLLGHGLVGHRLHDIGAGHEHVRAVLDHEDEVGHRRRIDRAAGARAHDQRDLRDDARGQHVALEHLGIAGERGDAVLDARAAGIVEADDRRADIHRLVHDLADLLGVRLAERAAEHGEILAEHKDQLAVDRAVAGDDAVARDLLLAHAEILAAVLDEHVPFLEGVGVEQDFERSRAVSLPLACCASIRRLPAAGARRRALFVEPAENVGHRPQLSNRHYRQAQGAAAALFALPVIMRGKIGKMSRPFQPARSMRCADGASFTRKARRCGAS